MKTCRFIKSFLMVAIVAIAFVATSCSKSQTEVNGFISSLNEYGQNIKDANSAEELNEVNNAFVKTMQKYSESKVELTAADHEAIAKAIRSLGTITNEKFTELAGGAAPLTQEQLDQRFDEFKTEIENCKTLGDVVNIGL